MLYATLPLNDFRTQIVDVEEHGFTDGEEEGPLVHSVRSKCVIQLLLLGALASLQVISILCTLGCILQLLRISSKHLLIVELNLSLVETILLEESFVWFFVKHNLRLIWTRNWQSA